MKRMNGIKLQKQILYRDHLKSDERRDNGGVQTLEDWNGSWATCSYSEMILASGDGISVDGALLENTR